MKFFHFSNFLNLEVNQMRFYLHSEQKYVHSSQYGCTVPMQFSSLHCFISSQGNEIASFPRKLKNMFKPNSVYTAKLPLLICQGFNFLSLIIS